MLFRTATLIIVKEVKAMKRYTKPQVVGSSNVHPC